MLRTLCGRGRPRSQYSLANRCLRSFLGKAHPARRMVKPLLIGARGTAPHTKKRIATSAQQRPEIPGLESAIVSALLFDNYVWLDSLTSHCLNPTVAMACS
jgi:hypothetical protein